MGSLISKYVKIALDVLLFALLLGIIIFFDSSSKNVLDLKRDSDSAMTELQTYRDVYAYVNADELTGDDIIRFTGLFKRLCDIEIVKNSETYVLTATDVTSDAWEGSKILSYLGQDVTKKFTVTSIRDEYSDKYTLITFTMK